MKNLLLLLAIIAIAVMSYFLFVNPSCHGCKLDTPIEDSFPKDLDLSLKFDCSSEEFQPLHLDLINSFGIFGKPKMQQNSTKMDIELIIIEVGTCKRYAIDSAVMNEEDSRSNEITIDFVIDEYTEQLKAKKSITIPVEVGRIIDMHILSPKFPELESKKTDSLIAQDDFVYYPPRICKAKIINGYGSRLSTTPDSLKTLTLEAIN